MRAHLRSELHDYMGKRRLAPAEAGEHPLTAEGIRRRVGAARDRLEVDR